MRIMSLNAWGGKLYDQLLPYIERTAPDVLCLQEVVHSPATKKDWLIYRDGDHVLSQRANLFRDVSRVLPEHVGTFCPAAQGVLWDGNDAEPSQWGLATFVHARFPVIGQVQGFVHKGYSPVGYGDHPRSRSAHGFRLYDYDQERPVCVTHMHGLCDLRGKMDTLERVDQAKRLCSLSQQVSEADDLAVLCGDFNVGPTSETLSILSEAGFSELVTARGFISTRTSLYQKPMKHADYMLVNRISEITSFDVVSDPEVSDHCPLLLSL